MVRKKYCILQSYPWKMIVQCACVNLNLEPLELTGLMIQWYVCMVSGKLFAKLETDVPVTWVLMSGLVGFPAASLSLPAAGSPGVPPAAQLVPPHGLI